ncbi:hypothetical protein BKA59DRAFT_220171 [Fusarium tricinctum]|uniref:Uncharacterized protein n=1 Tax=Fusarium tricinctum TaxID=61284 RepID=A0A8K0RTR8_9HYPO|nr:hypothetical protein BKA59DRAFT_220171 [Fusarium tricinctum]
MGIGKILIRGTLVAIKITFSLHSLCVCSAFCTSLCCNHGDMPLRESSLWIQPGPDRLRQLRSDMELSSALSHKLRQSSLAQWKRGMSLLHHETPSQSTNSLQPGS